MAGKEGRRGLRVATISAGFSVAHRLRRLGLVPLTSRARRVIARLTGDQISIEVAGATIGGSLIDDGEYLSLVSRGGPHPFQFELFTDTLEPGMVVVDCGAHIGLYSVIAGRRVGHTGEVFAVEPDAHNTEALRANVAANDLSGTVQVVQAAASNHAGTDRLHSNFGLCCGCSMLSSLSPHTERGERSIEVETVKLDDILGGRRVDVVKVDVEGAEALALEGMRKTLARSRGAVLFIECHPAALDRSGVSTIEWLAALRQAGPLELIDEARRRLVSATAEVISRQVDDRPDLAFNLRWTLI